MPSPLLDKNKTVSGFNAFGKVSELRYHLALWMKALLILPNKALFGNLFKSLFLDQRSKASPDPPHRRISSSLQQVTNFGNSHNALKLKRPLVPVP